jgi:hypothetical protein
MTASNPETPLPTKLKERLSALAHSLESSPDALGLLALGSIGQETERADRWSDLDFFVIVERGAKQRYLRNLDWLAAAHPIGWAFANTVDGYKALMDDGVLCEFAVFEPQEIEAIPYAPGRWAWRRTDELPDAWQRSTKPLPTVRPIDWLVGEALSNLLIGLQRLRRGERLAAMRMVQVYALDRLLEIIDQVEASAAGVPCDPFNADRRFEFRHPNRASLVAECAAGVDARPHSALAILAALKTVAPLPPLVVEHIETLAA